MNQIKEIKINQKNNNHTQEIIQDNNSKENKTCTEMWDMTMRGYFAQIIQIKYIEEDAQQDSGKEKHY